MKNNTKRTPLRKREFPNYTVGEEMTNMITHAVGAILGIIILITSIIISVRHHNAWAVTSSAIYGASVIVMFTVSSIYHGLNKNLAKQVMRIVDHCDIFFTIAGTYTPILLVGIRINRPGLAWIIFGIEWACAIIGATLNAIDLKKYAKFSIICYLAMGWCIIWCIKDTIEVMTFNGFMWLLGGGVAFTIGALLYVLGKTKHKKYAHSVFHVFVIVGVVLQFISILYII